MRNRMSLDKATSMVKEKVGTDSGLDAAVKFDFGDEGVIHIDAKSSPNEVTNDDKDADCTVSMSMDDFMQMATGDLDPTTAFMMGKLKVSGDMSVAMKLGSVI